MKARRQYSSHRIPTPAQLLDFLWKAGTVKATMEITISWFALHPSMLSGAPGEPLSAL